MNILLTKTDALGDQLLGFGFVRHLIRTTNCEHFFWLVRPGMEPVADLWAGSVVATPDQSLSPAEAAATLLRQLEGHRPAVAPVFIVVPMNAYQSWPPDRDLTSTVMWWGDFVRALQPAVAIAGSCTLNWVDWLLTLASGAPRRVAIAPGSPAQAVDAQMVKYLASATTFTDLATVTPLDHELDRFAAMGRCLGIPAGDGTIQVHPPECELPGGWATEDAIVIAPGAGDPRKQWPTDQLAAIVRQLDAGKVIIVAGPADKQVAGVLSSRLRELKPVMLESGAADVVKLAHLLSRSRLLICNETFIAHLAAAVGTPTVAIWGGGHWGRFVPRQGNVTVVYQPVACAHCDWNCIFDEFVCVTKTVPDVVMQAVRERLQKPHLPVTLREAPVSVNGDAVRERFKQFHPALKPGSGREWENWTEVEIAAKHAAQARAHAAEDHAAAVDRQLEGEQQKHARTEELFRAEQAKRSQLANELLQEQAARVRVEEQARREGSERRRLTDVLAREQEERARVEENFRREERERSRLAAALECEQQVRAAAETRADVAAATGRRLADALEQEQQTTAKLKYELELHQKTAELAREENDLLRKRLLYLSGTVGAVRTVWWNCARLPRTFARRLQWEWQIRSRLTQFRKSFSSNNRTLTVTLVNTHDIIGGAERTSYDLMHGLRRMGLNVQLLVGRKLGNDPNVVPMRFTSVDWKLSKFWRDSFGLTEIVYLTPLRIVRKDPLFSDARVVNIHNMHGRYWNLLTVPLIRRRVPLVLTLHDEFLLTGDCGYSYDCQKWLRSCGHCPQAKLDELTRYPAAGADRTRVNILIKRAMFHLHGRYPLHLVSPTNWLAERIRLSPNLRHLPVSVIPNGIPLDVWQPIPQQEARRQLELPADKIIGIFAASNLADRRKGIDVVVDVIKACPCRTEFFFICLGMVTDEFVRSLAGLPVRCVGQVRERHEVVRYLSAANLALVLSRADNLPYTVMESVACGRPVIGTRIGGIPEMIDAPELGWLVPNPPQTTDVVHILEQLPTLSPANWRAMSLACRKAAERKYSLTRMVGQYKALFEELVEKQRS